MLLWCLISGVLSVAMGEKRILWSTSLDQQLHSWRQVTLASWRINPCLSHGRGSPSPGRQKHKQNGMFYLPRFLLFVLFLLSNPNPNPTLPSPLMPRASPTPAANFHSTLPPLQMRRRLACAEPFLPVLQAGGRASVRRGQRLRREWWRWWWPPGVLGRVGEEFPPLAEKSRAGLGGRRGGGGGAGSGGPDDDGSRRRGGKYRRNEWRRRQRYVRRDRRKQGRGCS